MVLVMLAYRPRPRNRWRTGPELHEVTMFKTRSPRDRHRRHRRVRHPEDGGPPTPSLSPGLAADPLP